ncbi:MAG TPA: O-antigen ligase family protein [Humisphaera sp.]
MSVPHLVTVLMVASAFQLFVVPVGEVYLPLSLAFAFACVPLLDWSAALRHRVARCACLLFAAQAASLAWSADRPLGVREILFSSTFLMGVAAGVTLVARAPGAVLPALRVYCVAALAQSVAVIAFRAAPDVESQFWSSPLARVVINPNGLDALFTINGSNNVLDPAKAGGFLLNANIAGAWGALLFFTSLACFRGSNRWARAAVAGTHLLGVVACGSKASLAIICVAPVVAMVLFGRPGSGRQSRVRVIVPVLAALAATAGVIAWTFVAGSEYGSEAAHALESRSILWAHAWDEFLRKPVQGQGYGGWIEALVIRSSLAAKFGLRQSFPPHNSLLILWSQSGLPALAAGVATAAAAFRHLRRPAGTPDQHFAFCATAAYAFVFIQCLGENYGIFGDPHMNVPVGVLIGVAAGLPVVGAAAPAAARRRWFR